MSQFSATIRLRAGIDSGAEADYCILSNKGATKMADTKIVTLEPMRVASVYGYGPSPETEAWAKLMAWAKPKGLFDGPEMPRIFGFNNPSPSPGSPNYGYEYWITVGPGVEPEEGVRIVEFGGGMYAVARLPEFHDAETSIPQAWKELVAWIGDSRYKGANHQWLEEHFVSPENVEDIVYLDLYAPVAE
jgi:DNA gyrase inhibitor GyrI